MSAQPKPGGLPQANRRIALLLDDLEVTVDSVEMLTRLGRHEEAARLVDHQRAKLRRAVESIASDVARPRVRRWESARKHVAAAVAAAAVAMSVLVVGGPSSPIDAATNEFDRAMLVADPVARLAALTHVFELTRAIPPRDLARTTLGRDLSDALEDSRERVDDRDPKLADEAERMVRELQQGRVPAPPQSGVNPVEELEDQISTDCTTPADGDC